MKKQLFAVFCVLTIFASTAPIFAASPSTTHNNTAVLTANQTAKLNTIQTQLNNLLTKINGLQSTYNNTTNTSKGKYLLNSWIRIKNRY